MQPCGAQCEREIRGAASCPRNAATITSAQLAPLLLRVLGSSAEGLCGIPRAQGAHPKHSAGEAKGRGRGADPAEHWGCPQPGDKQHHLGLQSVIKAGREAWRDGDRDEDGDSAHTSTKPSLPGCRDPADASQPCISTISFPACSPSPSTFFLEAFLAPVKPFPKLTPGQLPVPAHRF